MPRTQPLPAPHSELWVLSHTDLDDLGVSYQRVLEIVQHAFVALREGDSHNPLKTIVQPADQRSIAYSMVGRDAASETLGFKMVYEFDPRRTRNAYRFHSFIFLCDDVTGQPIALMDVVKLGPLRTSATSALMARAAHPQARSALVVGTGVQGRIALPMLLAALPGLERLMVYGQHPAGLLAVQDEVRRLHPQRQVEIVTDLEAAAGQADIVIGAAGLSARQPVRRAWLKPGAVAVLPLSQVVAGITVRYGASLPISASFTPSTLRKSSMLRSIGNVGFCGLCEALGDVARPLSKPLFGASAICGFSSRG